MNHRNLDNLCVQSWFDERHMYLCEACILCLCRNGLEFFWQTCTPKSSPHTGSEVFLIIFYLLYFSLCQMRQKRVNFILDPIDFLIHLYKILIPRAHQILCKSLALFWIFSWVDSVQPIIKWCRRAEIELNLRKQQTIFGKSQTWCFLHTWHVQA